MTTRLSASVLIPCRADLADRLKKGSTNPALSACRGHAVVVKVDHRVRVAQRCLRPPDDLRVDIACWLGSKPGEKHYVFRLRKQRADLRRWKPFRPGKFEHGWQRRSMHALHLAIECRDGFGIRFSCRHDYNFHGQELGGQEHGGVEPIPSELRDELSQTAVTLSRREDRCKRAAIALIGERLEPAIVSVSTAQNQGGKPDAGIVGSPVHAVFGLPRSQAQARS